ncbi:hypothetical protein [Clostridium sp.]|uniref:hypothetical protein n=1 Tax=Clostridium sp. TaxID=1506 RepID=UPI001A613C73|nr:hypothetical protein [Clostridium sp.]MBK5241548.1 hypothetical protein [Clostridium sp.]
MSIYFLMLLMMLLLLYQGIISSLFYSPKRIKIISTMILILMTLRYTTLLILFVVKNQNYLYLLKPVLYANILCIPICGILTVFIFARNDKVKIKNIFILCIVLGLAYCTLIYKSSVEINISNITGYTMELQLETYYYIALLIINSFFVIKGIELFNKIYSNKLGVILIIVSSSITLITVIISSININFEWLLLADISWIITLDYGLIKFKR